MKQNSIWRKILYYGLAAIIVLGVIYFAIGSKNLRIIDYAENYAKVSTTQITPNLSEGVTIRQSFVVHGDYMSGVVLRFATYGDTLKDGNITVVLKDEKGNELAKADTDVSKLKDNEDYTVEFSEKVSVKRGEKLSIEIQEVDNTDGQTATLWMGDLQEDCELQVNGSSVENTLYFNPIETRNGYFKIQFAIVMVVILILFIALCLFEEKKDNKGDKTGVGECVHIFDQYSFLLKQLVGRDFAVKYRRSYLGVVWVILNPLLSMIVLSAVFSFIFRFNIENFSVYLILGQIMFNFFSEATQISITTITGAGQMIKKIYVPKYIFPLSKTMFSFLNFILSFIPVVLVMAYYRIPLTINVVYLPALLLTYFCFVLGVGLMLAAVQVFMRDTQYLYGILLTLLGYLTPIFYSIDSLSPLFQKIMLLNPLFHYMNTLRTILLYGETPSVAQMACCAGIGVVMLGIGITYFHKRQKRFILYI